MPARVLVLTGYGINCEEETCWAFNRVGADARIVHVNDLVDGVERLRDWQVLVIPGGFSYGDDTGSGKALANRLRNTMEDELWRFAEEDRLVLGICNGFQVLACLGLLPFPQEKEPKVALTYNRSGRHECRWVDLAVEESPCIFTRGLASLRMPVSHGEGRFVAGQETCEHLSRAGQIVVRYCLPGGGPAAGAFPANPNGSLGDVAGICDSTGRIFGLMPHPERAFLFLQRDDWLLLADRVKRRGEALPEFGDGYQVFRNVVEYLS